MAQVPPVPARRSPRISSQRDVAIKKTISPLVTSHTKETKRQNDQVKELRRTQRVKSPTQPDGHPRDETVENNLLRGYVEKTDHSCNPEYPKAVRGELTSNITEVRKERATIAGTSKVNIPSESNTRKSNRLSLSVPDSPGPSVDSVQVRELRKIQDYWTRKSPASEQSPRLRSSLVNKSGVNDEIISKEKETFKQNRHKIEASSQKRCHVQEIHDHSLPESPVPRNASEIEKSVETRRSSRTATVTQSRDSNAEKTDAESMSPKHHGLKQKCSFEMQKSNITVIRIKLNHENLVEVTSESPTRKLNTQTTPTEGGNLLSPIDKLHKSPKHATVGSDSLTEIIVKNFTESDSDNDDDYIPPRKKLRSEVSRDELWEGFPSFSFKRLAPIRKSGESSRCNTPNTSTESEDDLIDIRETPKTVELIAKETLTQKKTFTDQLALTPSKLGNSEKTENVPNSGSETLVNTSDLPSVSRLATNETHSPALDTEKKINCLSPNLHSEGKTVDNQTDNVPHVPKKASIRKRKFNDSPNVPLKRSARLQEKQTTSPAKSVDSRPTNCKTDIENNQNTCKFLHVENEDLNDSNNTTGNSNPKEVMGFAETSSIPDVPNLNQEKCGKIQFADSNYTQIKYTSREISILEILSRDFNEQSTSPATEIENNKASLSNENEVTKVAIIDADKNSDLDTSEVRKAPDNDKIPKSDKRTKESVSQTLLSLFKANCVNGKESKTETIHSNELVEKPESQTDDFLHNIERDHSVKTHGTNNESTSILDDYAYNSSSNDYIVHSLKVIDEVHEEKEKVKSLKFSCSTASCDEKMKDGEGSGTKKDIPPLRIKLKLKSEQLKKKNLKQRKDKAKLKDERKDKKVRNASEISDNKHNKPSGSATDKKNKPKKKNKKNKPKKKNPTSTDGNQEAEKAQDETTPKAKKLKKPASKRRKSSPVPSNMELRLNNERRRSVADEMLTNPVIDKHACVIWSSENRRHVVLSKPDASHADVDDILRKKWEKLSDKEKLRYFQRAVNAIKDENRHSNRRHEDASKPAEPTPSTSTDPNPPLMRFIMMTPGEQLTELKKWLHFYHDVSVEEYDNVLTSFKETLQKEKTEKEKEKEKDKDKQTDNTNNKLKSKAKKKGKGSKQHKDDLFDDFHAQARYRKLLFEKIFEVKDKVLKLWKEGKEKQKEKLHENFSGMVKKLITGDSVDFSGNVVSGRLTEVLKDIKNLETSRKLGVSGKELQSESFLNLVNNIKQEIENVNFEKPTNSQAGSVTREHEIPQSSDGGLPHLNPTSIQEVFNEISSSDNVTYRHSKPRPSPSLMLTSCVIADLLEDQVVQEEAGLNINNNMSQTAQYTYSNRGFRSILNLEDLKRKYGTQLQSGAETNVVSSDAYARNAGFRNMENGAASIQSKVSVPQKKFVNLSNHCISGSRAGVVALQHYDNGRPVVRYARIKPGAHSAAHLRLLGQRQRMRFTPQVRFTGLTSRNVDETKDEKKRCDLVSYTDKSEADMGKTDQIGPQKN